MAPDFGGKPWGLMHYASVKSAIRWIRPEAIYFYYQFEPSGPWWELTRPLLTPIKIQAPEEIFGRPLLHFAHRADVVRLRKLIEQGGIYLDADVIVQRSFDDLLDHSMVLGQEGENGRMGMANAIMLAEPNAKFLLRWIETYRNFRSKGQDAYWSEHSVQIPSLLAEQHPDEIKILPYRAFFWPLWTDDHIRWIFDSADPIPMDETYANHLWESLAWNFIEDLTPGAVRRRETNFHRWLRPYVEDLADDFGAPPLHKRLLRAKARAIRRGRATLKTLRGKAAAIWHGVRDLDLASPAGADNQQARRRAFQKVYRRKLWGREAGSKYFSGVGSRGEAMEIYVDRMSALLLAHAQELGRPLRIVDLGCGDFEVARALLQRLPGFTYVGCDIVPELVAYNQKNNAGPGITFRQLDIVSDPLPEGDVCLVRQVLQHLSNADISDFLLKVRFPLVYVTEGHPAVRVGPFNPDKAVGHEVRFDWNTGKGRGVELDKPPFNAQTTEVFRAAVPPYEVVVTERLFISAAASEAVQAA